MIKIASLHIYPIKGMQGVSVSNANALERGFEHDRRYMLIDEEGTFISQRSHPELVFFFPEIIDNQLIVSYEDVSFRVPLSSSLDSTISTTIFNNPVQATEVSVEANSWFSTILKKEVRLVKMNKSDVRYKSLIKGPEKVEVSFADGYPYLIAGTESINLLNAKLDVPIALNRFRPNIVVETTEAHVEDTWERIKIGNIEFMVIKPCGRCPVVTVDQSTGARSKEPLKTLATYRKKDNLVYFGANTICREEGRVHIGDEVVVL